MNFKKYLTYSVEDFTQNEDFVRWVKEEKASDNQFWETLQLEHANKYEEIKEAKAIVSAMLKVPTQANLSFEEKAEMLQNMQQQIQRNQEGNNKQQYAKLRMVKSWRAAAAAAAILLIGLATWFYVNEKAFLNQTKIATTNGQQQSIELPDGSNVKLNANSSLTFDKNWDNQENRKVWLRGEAFFEVEKKVSTGQKFQVITKDLTVEVLGTIFNVNSHQEATKVFLEEGKIKLNLNGLKQTTLMLPGELVAYSESKKEQPIKSKVLPALHTSWKDGILQFENTPLKEVLEKLEEIYGVTFEVENTAHYAREIDTGVPIGNLEDAISILDATMDLRIIKRKNSFIIQ